MNNNDKKVISLYNGNIEPNNSDMLDNIKEEDNRYMKILSGESTAISNFTITPLELIQGDGGAELRLQINHSSNEVFTTLIKAIDFSSVSRFKSALNKIFFGLSFKGNANDLEDIKELILAKEFKIIKSVNFGGVHKMEGKGYVFVSGEGTINQEGKIVDEIVLAGQSIIDTKLTSRDEISALELTEISGSLFRFNKLDVTVPILGFVAGCFLKERLWISAGQKFYNLIITGEAETGKSQTKENIIWPILDTKCSITAGDCTNFSNLKLTNSNNAIPLIVDEYKPTRMTKRHLDIISDLLRNAYDMNTSVRGKQDQGINSYTRRTPVVVIGEMGQTEKAGIDRSIVVALRKESILNEQTKENFLLLKHNKDLLNKLGRSILQQALSVSNEKLLDRKQRLDDIYLQKFPDRIGGSISCCILGLELIKDVFVSKGIGFEESIGFTVEELVSALKSAINHNMLSENQKVIGIVDSAIETFNDLAELDYIVKGRDYKVINGTNLALNIKAFYPKYIKYLNSRKISADILPQDEFTKQLARKEYYLGYKAVRFKETIKPTKAYIVDIEKISKEINVDSLVS